MLENQGESGLVRISMIINEHNAHWLYLDLMKMAIAMGDESLATKLYNMSCTKYDNQKNLFHFDYVSNLLSIEYLAVVSNLSYG